MLSWARPHPLAADAIGQVAQRNLPGHCDEPTNPNAHAAVCAENPNSIRCLVCCACTAYQANRAPKYPMGTHQKRAVRNARPSVQPAATQVSYEILCRFTGS